MAQQQDAAPQDWQQVMASGDKEMFRSLVEPHMEVLLKAARSDLHYYVAQRHLHRQDFTPEEVVGQALIYAWEHREQRPEPMSLRGWLLGIQHRTLRGMVSEQQDYRAEKALSLDAPVPINADAYDTQEWFWDFYQPETEITWEDIIPGREPIDLEVPLDATHETLTLEPETRHVLMMHDEFEMPLPEVAFTMNRAVNEVAGLLEEARATLRERLASERPLQETDHPAPPEGSDQ